MIRDRRVSSGFTLIELIIVVLIIGILAAIAVPAYTGYAKKAKVSGVVSAMGAVTIAIAAYYKESGAVRDTTAALGSVGDVGSIYGVAPPTQYISNMSVVSGNISTVLTNIGSDVNGATLNLNTTDFREWKWSGNLSPAYKPK
jgi:type IV pilus assembly protein PilA